MSRLVALMLALLVWACGGDEGPANGLEAALARARPVTFSDGPPTRWLSPVPLRGLNDHLVEVTLEATLSRERSQKLLITRRIERRERRFRVTESRTHTYPSVSDPSASLTHSETFEALFDGTQLAVRRGEGPFIERDARDGLPARILTRLHDLVPFLLDGLARDLRLEPLGAHDDTTPAEVAGLPVDWRRVVFVADAGPHLEAAALADLRTLAPRLHEWFGASVDITRGGGRAAFVRPTTPAEESELIDAAGRPRAESVLVADFTFEGTARLEGGPGTLSLRLVQTVSRLGEASFDLPLDRLPEARERPWMMIEDVLGDALLRPYRGP